MLDFSLIGYTDVRNIISDDDSLQEGVLPALEEYNLTQFTVADVPGADHQVCPLNIFPTFVQLPTSAVYRQRGCEISVK